MRAHPKNSGYTYVEMALVVIIIGLIIGMMTSAKTLYRSYELRSAISQQERYSIATRFFLEKYNYLPGDFPAATTVLLPLEPDCVNKYPGSTTTTCNGDGSGIIGPNTNTSIDWTSNLARQEAGAVWQHLFVSGFLNEGTFAFCGVTPPHPSFLESCKNAPRSKVGGWFILEGFDSPFNVHGWPQMLYSNWFRLSQKGFWGTNFGFTGLLAADDAHEIDVKIDDGKPGMGDVMSTDIYGAGIGGIGGTCTTTNTAITAAYTSGPTSKCDVSFRFKSGTETPMKSETY